MLFFREGLNTSLFMRGSKNPGIVWPFMGGVALAGTLGGTVVMYGLCVTMDENVRLREAGMSETWKRKTYDTKPHCSASLDTLSILKQWLGQFSQDLRLLKENYVMYDYTVEVGRLHTLTVGWSH